MFAYLQGKYTYKSPAQVYLEVNGVGYEVNISLNTFSEIQHLNEGRLYTYLQIKEDGHVLFGFSDKDEKDIFLLLISVSGVGASTARMMLSSIKPDEISRAIVQGNIKLLESVKGIGKKTAERLVLELKDKIGKHYAPSVTATAANSLENDAINALIALGISKQQADQAIQKTLLVDSSINSLEVLIKQSLKAI